MPRKKKKDLLLEQKEDANLPNSRWAQFLDILRYRFWDILLGSIFACLFLVPCLLWIVFAAMNELIDMGSMYSILVVYGVAAVLFSIAGLGSAGLYYFYRKLVYGEGANLINDFPLGIKKCWKEGLISHFVLGLLYLILKLDIGALSSYVESETVLVVLLGISYALFYILASLVLFYMPQAVLYEGSFFRLIGNSWRFYVGSFFKSLGISLLFFVPFFVYELINSWTGEWITIGIFCLLYGFLSLGVSLYCTSLFDVYINPRYYPELVRKGLSPLSQSMENPKFNG